MVVVSYSGCKMEPLYQCVAPVKYAYVPFGRKFDRVRIRNVDDLYAKLPAFAANFEAQLARSGELEVDLTMVGRWEAERTSLRLAELSGDCQQATHVVSAVTVGAFTFSANAAANAKAEAGALGGLAGGQSQSKREELSSDGNPAACAHASLADTSPPNECGAMLRLEVVKVVRPAAPTAQTTTAAAPPARRAPPPPVESAARPPRESTDTPQTQVRELHREYSERARSLAQLESLVAGLEGKREELVSGMSAEQRQRCRVERFSRADLSSQAAARDRAAAVRERNELMTGPAHALSVDGWVRRLTELGVELDAMSASLSEQKRVMVELFACRDP